MTGTVVPASGAEAESAAPWIVLRPPTAEDAAAIWRLVERSSLDTNSPYAYLMLARYFARTGVVAEVDGELAGFVAAFRPPEAPDTLFVWQVGVSEAARGQGLATRMLSELLHRPSHRDVIFLEATVTPGNSASLALFRGMAARLGTECAEGPCFERTHFPGQGHEPELLLRIGPIPRGAQAAPRGPTD